MLLVRESGDDLARLEVIDHGEALLADIREKQQPSKRAVQRYLDRLKEIDFNGYSIPEKQRVAEAVNAITQ